MFRHVLSFYLLMILSCNVFSQINEQVDKGILYKHENVGMISANSNGIGIGYRAGSFLNGYKLRVLEVDFSNLRDMAEIKTQDINRISKSYYYGKLQYVYPLRFYYGYQKAINTKPYWGGVELRYLALIGPTFSITKPVYLYILDSDREFVIQKYEKDVPQDDIGGRAPFKEGLNELKILPALSFKGALNFEFGQDQESSRAIETGLIVDFYPKPLQIMAFKPEKYLLFTLYLSYNFGQRFNK